MAVRRGGLKTAAMAAMVALAAGGAGAEVVVYVGGTTNVAGEGNPKSLMAYTWTPGSFSLSQTATPGGAAAGVSDIAVGDINGDAILDVVVGRSDIGQVHYWADGDLATTAIDGDTFQTGPVMRLEVADLNADGRADIVTKTRNGAATIGLIQVFAGTASGISGQALGGQSGAWKTATAMTITARDADGVRNDLVLGRSDSFVEIRSGSSMTSQATAFQPGAVQPASFLSGHFTSTSGREDFIMVTNIPSPGDDVVYYLNNGGAYSGKGSISQGNTSAGAATTLISRREGAVADVDNDGLDEALVLNQDGTRLFVFSFSVDGTTVTKALDQTLTGLSDATRLTVADLNLDGHDDVLVGSSDGTLSAYLTDAITHQLVFDASIDTGQTGMTGLAASVPEPVGFSLAGAASLLLLGRRRRAVFHCQKH